jgi:uncharacterized linocin/CFP29 family protein
MARRSETQEYSYGDDRIVTDGVERKAIKRSVSAENRAHSRLRNGEDPGKVYNDLVRELDEILDDFARDLGIRPG